MKTRILKSTTVVVIAIVAMSFSFVKNELKKVNVKESKISWIGKKEIGSDHKGTINIESGALEFDKKKLVGGEIIVDMTSITVTDLEGDYKYKLEGHLNADDFFDTAKFKTSKIVFTKVVAKDGVYNITGDITIKGITESIVFDLHIHDNTASTTLHIDRTKFGIKYGSSSFFDGLKDKAIKNKFELNVKLVF